MQRWVFGPKSTSSRAWVGAEPKSFAAGAFSLRAFGLVNPAMREYLHTLYQFTQDWVVSDAKFRAAFGDDRHRLLDMLIALQKRDRRVSPAAMQAVAERLGASDTVRNFLGVLARQRRLGALGAIIDEFARLLAAHRGEETAQVTSAVPLDEAQLGTVREAVAKFAGRPVQLAAEVDPALLGGVVVRVGSRMVDASLRTKLQNLENSMRGVR